MALVEILYMAAWFILLFTAAFFDCKMGKIPNKIILTGIVIATVLAALRGEAFLWSAVAGGTLALVVGFCFWKLRIFRAGDAKLLWMTMQFAGLEQWPQHLAAIFIAGGGCALYIMLRHGILLQRMKRIWNYFVCMFLSRKFNAYTPVENDTVRFPFAVAVVLAEVYMQAALWICW